jgi:hypothetical protein
MILYKVFYKNYELQKGDFVGMLIERRRDLRGMKRVESGLRWAKLTFGRKVKDEKSIIVVPSDLNLGNNIKWLTEKGVFTKEELIGMSRLIEKGIKKENR